MATKFYTYEESLKSSHHARMQRVLFLARYLDARWKVPGTDFKVGLDGVLGLVPVLGDSIAAVLASYILYEAHKMGVPWYVKLRMLWNIVFDWMLGLVPIVGDILDMANKSNLKNIRILHEHLEKRARGGR